MELRLTALREQVSQRVGEPLSQFGINAMHFIQ
jgi:hypothetical protein